MKRNTQGHGSRTEKGVNVLKGRPLLSVTRTRKTMGRVCILFLELSYTVDALFDLQQVAACVRPKGDKIDQRKKILKSSTVARRTRDDFGCPARIRKPFKFTIRILREFSASSRALQSRMAGKRCRNTPRRQQHLRRHKRTSRRALWLKGEQDFN